MDAIQQSMLQPQYPPTMVPIQKKKKRLKWYYFPVSFMILFLLLAVVMAATSPGAPVLNHSLSFVTDMDVGGTSSWTAGPGSIVVVGTITNSGTFVGGGSIHLRVFTGYNTIDYDVSTGVVPAGGSVPFHWEQHYDMLSPLNATVKVSLVN